MSASPPPRNARRRGPAKPRRLGRPPATDSADTRRRILDIARASFAAGGYDSATNRAIAEEVGITAAALYHYFGSKLDLYVAVNDDAQERMYGRFNAAVASAGGFVERFEAVLDTAHELNNEDPTLAAFLGTVRTDIRWHREIADVLGSQVARRERFFIDLVDDGVASGDIDPENRKFMIAFVMTILVGLTDGVSDDPERHQRSVQAIKKAIRGTLLDPPI